MSVENKEDLIRSLKKLCDGPNMIVVKVKKCARKDLGRPVETPAEIKKQFMGKI